MIILTSDQRPDAEIKRALDAAVNDARQQWKPLNYEEDYPRNGFGRTTLRPRTVGVASDYWSASVTTSWANWISHTLDDTQYVIVTGIQNRSPDPAITGILPTANGQDLSVLHIEELWAAGQGLGYLPKPFVVTPNNSLVIQIVGSAAASERFGLLGYEVVKRAVLINKTP